MRKSLVFIGLLSLGLSGCGEEKEKQNSVQSFKAEDAIQIPSSSDASLIDLTAATAGTYKLQNFKIYRDMGDQKFVFDLGFKTPGAPDDKTDRMSVKTQFDRTAMEGEINIYSLQVPLPLQLVVQDQIASFSQERIVTLQVDSRDEGLWTVEEMPAGQTAGYGSLFSEFAIRDGKHFRELTRIGAVKPTESGLVIYITETFDGVTNVIEATFVRV